MPKVFSINVEKIGRMPFFDFLKMFAMFMVLWGALYSAFADR